MNRRAKVLRGVGVGGLLLALGLGAYTYHPREPLPDLGPFLVKARDYDVTVVRDHWGVPSILAKRDVDAAFGLGYAHAEDDWETMQTVLLATRGRLAERDGPKAVPTDVVVALLKVWETVDAGYATRLTPEVRALCEAYADGLNTFAARHPGRVAAGLLPLRGQDVVAGFVFKTPFFYGLDHTLGTLLDKERRPHLNLAGKTAFHVTTAPTTEIGSNAFAIAPQRSGDGTTRLVVNSHQPFTGPVAWWEARVLSEQGWEVAGGFFPGSPFMLHGHNRQLGWAATVNQPDLTDVFVLDLDPSDPKRYKLDGTYRKMETRHLKIPVHLFGPFAFPLPYDVDFTVHGPVVRGKHAAYAVRYAGQNEVRHVDQYFGMNKAHNRDEWLAAMRLNALPSINFTYADAVGNIGYVHNAMMPLRKEGFDWSLDLPGDREDLVWSLTDRVPFAGLPQLWNPPSGALFNANNTPLHATDGPGNLTLAAFSPTFGLEQQMTNRALRAEELLRATPVVNREALLRIKFDDHYAQGSRAAAVKAQLLALPEPTDPVLKEARRVLALWDLSAGQTNPTASIGLLTFRLVVVAEHNAKPVADVAPMFADASRWLMSHFGRIEVPWGEVNRLHRGTLDLPLDGGPDMLRAVYGDLADDGHVHATVGDSLIMLIEWGKDGQVHSESVHQFGSATLDATSPNYADQSPLFAEKRFKPVPFDRAAVLASGVRTYRPGRE